MELNQFVFKSGISNLVSGFDSDFTGELSSKEQGVNELEKSIKYLRELQDKFFAHNKHGLLVILQGMDASGKDGIIKHVMSGLNPLGCKAYSFSTPSKTEFNHDFMWRCLTVLPERGEISIFNRSYYEEVLIARIHPSFLEKQNLPYIPQTEEEFEEFWNRRFTDINNFEQYFENNGFHVLKIYLNISKDEQKRRFMKRIERAAKNWKFKPDDIAERKFWDEYMDKYNDMMHKTSTENIPWHIIPANKKWFARLAVCNLIINKLESLDIHYPDVSYAHKRKIIEAKEILLNEE